MCKCSTIVASFGFDSRAMHSLVNDVLDVVGSGLGGLLELFGGALLVVRHDVDV